VPRTVPHARVTARNVCDFPPRRRWHPSRWQLAVRAASHVFDALGRSEKLDQLINAYNALRRTLILARWAIDSTRKIPASQRWNAVRRRIGGHQWSLNPIEQNSLDNRDKNGWRRP
jgi:hypothetical protein